MRFSHAEIECDSGTKAIENDKSSTKMLFNLMRIDQKRIRTFLDMIVYQIDAFFVTFLAHPFQ